MKDLDPWCDGDDLRSRPLATLIGSIPGRHNARRGHGQISIPLLASHGVGAAQASRDVAPPGLYASLPSMYLK